MLMSEQIPFFPGGDKTAAGVQDKMTQEQVKLHTVPKRPQLGDFEHRVLVAVRDCGDEAYGLRVTERLMEQNSNLAVAQVYISLRRLEEKGFLASHTEPSRPIRGGRARKVFRLEGRGEQVLEQSAAYHHALVTSGRFSDPGGALDQTPAQKPRDDYAGQSDLAAACG